MKKTLFGIIIVMVSLVVFYFLAVEYENYKYRTTAEELINSVEEFSSSKGRLPNSVSELNLDYGMGSGPNYVKTDSLSYIIYYAMGFDENYVYNSKTKTWENQP